MHKENITMISLGYNCEVSYRIADYLQNNIDSYPRSWAFILAGHGLLDFIETPDAALSGSVKLMENGMFKDENYEICFHGRRNPTQVNDDENVEIVIAEVLQELKARTKYLVEKWKTSLSGDSPILFIIKISVTNETENMDYVEQVYDALKRKRTGKFALLVVLEAPFGTNWSKLEKENLYICTIKFFAPIECTEHGGDIEGWISAIKYAEKRLRCEDSIPE